MWSWGKEINGTRSNKFEVILKKTIEKRKKKGVINTVII